MNRRTLVLLVPLLALSSLARADEPSPFVSRVLARAREEVARAVAYDPSYVPLPYPNGDVDPSRGVCTDVIVRALRAGGMDLQALVHQDILARPRAYAPFVSHPDASIDHRRVGPLMVWLDGHATRLGMEDGSFEAGDLVVWSLRGHGTPEHIGLVSDRRGASGAPLVIHNIGPRPSEDDALHDWKILGHWRLPIRS